MRTWLPTAVVLAFVATTACGGGENGGTTDPPDPLELTAVWQLTTTVNSNTCGLPNGSSSTDRIILIQCGSRASVIAGAGLWGSATISGQNLSFTGTEIQTDETEMPIHTPVHRHGLGHIDSPGWHDHDRRHLRSHLVRPERSLHG